MDGIVWFLKRSGWGFLITRSSGGRSSTIGSDKKGDSGSTSGGYGFAYKMLCSDGFGGC